MPELEPGRKPHQRAYSGEKGGNKEGHSDRLQKRIWVSFTPADRHLISYSGVVKMYSLCEFFSLTFDYL